MRKFLSVIAWAVAAIALIIGGIICLSQIKEVPSNMDFLKTYGTAIGLGIGLLGGGIASAVACLASFFTAKTKEK